MNMNGTQSSLFVKALGKVAVMCYLIHSSIPKMGLLAPTPGCSIAEFLRRRFPTSERTTGRKDIWLVMSSLHTSSGWSTPILQCSIQVIEPLVGRARRRAQEVLRHTGMGSFVQSQMGPLPQEEKRSWRDSTTCTSRTRRVVASPRCQVKSQQSFPWMKGFLWILDQMTEAVFPRPWQLAVEASVVVNPCDYWLNVRPVNDCMDCSTENSAAIKSKQQLPAGEKSSRIDQLYCEQYDALVCKYWNDWPICAKWAILAKCAIGENNTV